jgi:prepilin-type N-terminal cleavage/methylation domain-containing protein
MMMTAKKGFTLIELAIVIAIIAILSAVAIPRFAGLQGNAEKAVAQNFMTQLNTALATATAEGAGTPASADGFSAFVTDVVADVGKVSGKSSGSGTPFRFTIATPRIPNSSGTACTVASAAITCTGFSKLNPKPTFTYNANGMITNNLDAVAVVQ